MKTLLRSATALLILAAIAAPVRATIDKNPLKITLVRPAPAVEPGRPLSATIRFAAAEDLVLEDLRLEGLNWRVAPGAVAGNLSLSAGDLVDLEFTATPGGKDDPLRLSWIQDGRRRSRGLGIAAEARRRRKAATSFIPPGMPREAANLRARPDGDLPGPELPLAEILTRPTTDLIAEGEEAIARTITVQGYVYFRHETGWMFPCRNNIVVIHAFCGPYNPLTFPAAVTSTDEDGFFTCSFDASCDPDVYLTCGASNPRAEIQEDTLMEDTWIMRANQFNVTGDLVDFGTLIPNDTETNQAFFIAELIQRAREFYSAEHLMDIPKVEVLFPDDDNEAYYKGYWEEIHLGRSRGWNEGTILHEYGHHWAKHFTYDPDFDYCDPWQHCDDINDWALDDCGHCMWCRESGAVAWNEALAHIISRLATDYIDQTWTFMDFTSPKEIQTTAYGCDGSFQDPKETEGFFAALLYDLCDDDGAENDTLSSSACVDVLSGLETEMFTALCDECPRFGFRPHAPMQFVYCFKDRYPELANDFWETGMNNGYDCDEESPGLATWDFSIPVAGAPTPDNSVFAKWHEAPDDASGTAGYAVEWSNDGSDPGHAIETSAPWTESPLLAPGTWYLSVRSIDRAGHPAQGYAVFGPFIIQEPGGADLKHEYETGWDQAIVARNDDAATSGNVHVSSTLDGGQETTYWSARFTNEGDQGTMNWELSAYVDGDYVQTEPWALLGPGQSAQVLNMGPITVSPGRHILGLHLDSGGAIAEDNEGNNYYAWQYAWRSDDVVGEEPAFRPAPPPITGGWDYYDFSSMVMPYYNCRGHRRNVYYPLHQVIYIQPGDISVDYDLRLFGPETRPEVGFRLPIAESLRPAACLDGVVIFGLNAGAFTDHDVGVYNLLQDGAYGDCGYYIQQVDSEALGNAYGTYYPMLGNGNMVALYTFQFESAADGLLSFLMTPMGMDPPPVTMAYYGDDWSTGGLLEADAIVQSYDGDAVQIDVPGETLDFGGIAVWRDIASDINSPLTVRLEYMISRCDLSYHQPEEWFAPLVPYPEPTVLWPLTSVPAPDRLTGGEDSTWVYIAVHNEGLRASPLAEVSIRLDGQEVWSLERAPIDAGAWSKIVPASRLNVPGGRHTLTYAIDPDSLIVETREFNNVDGRQWAWSPPELGIGDCIDFPAPPPADGGWPDVHNGYHYYNCLGYRTEDMDSGWGEFGVVFLAGDDSTDLDLRIHPDYDDPYQGFLQYEESSSWSTGEPDYIVIDLDQTGYRAYNLGVVRVFGEGGGVVGADVSGFGIGSVGAHGPFNLAADQFFHVLELSLPAGLWPVTLTTPGDSNVDLGLAAHARGELYSPRENFVPGGAAWLAAAGEPEAITVDADFAQTFALVVFRTGLADRDEPVAYTLTIGEDLTGVGAGGPPVAGARISRVAPNPFNPMVGIFFETAGEQRAEVRIYNVDGRLVRKVASGVYPAGRHSVEWDGRDQEGAPAASGIYFATLETESGRSTRKITLVR